MLKFLVPIVYLLLSAEAIYYQELGQSAASPAQIRFAIENKYDDTGPGAKGPEYAYSTYKHIDDAIIGYLEDPDTKLPENERNRAVERLTKPDRYQSDKLLRYFPKTVEEYTGFKPTEPTEVPPAPQSEFVSTYKPQIIPQMPQYQVPLVLTKVTGNKYNYNREKEIFREFSDPYRVHRLKPLRVSPLSLAHYTREKEQSRVFDQYNPHPKYTFAYGVHEPDTGDSKSAKETREGGTVRGYYSFLDADGKQRTVHYTADDKQGFRAVVERSDPKRS